MTKTRRKAKEDAEAAESSPAGPSQAYDDDAHSDVLTVAIPDELNQHHLAEILPEIPDLNSVTPDVVVFLYELVAKQYALLDSSSRDLDELRADSERKDVELEQAFLEKESLSKDFDTSIASVQEELTQVKQGRDKLAEENVALKAQISTLSQSQSSSTSELDALKHQVEETEREKRDLMGVISRSKQEEAQREEEVQSLRASLKEARQDYQKLESQIRELRSMETSTKFKVDSLSQQLQLAQTEAERSNTELATKTEEYAKYRRTKHAEILTLQSSYDSLSQEHTATQASLKALQSAHSAQTNQLTQALSKIQALTSQIVEQETKYSSEANGLKRLVDMMEEREKQAKEIVEGIESQWATIGEKAERRENALKEQLEHEAKRREEAEKRVDQLESVLSRMGRGELPVPGTPIRVPGTPGAEFDGMLGLSPTVALASKSQRSGKTFTEVYTDYVRLQEEYAKKCAEHDQMDRTLSAVLAEIEERAPLLSQQRVEYERVKTEASELSAQLSQALADRDAHAKLAEEHGQKLKKSAAENNLLQQQLNDLGRQIQALLRQIARRDDPTIPSDNELENVPFVPADNVNEIITNNLVLFRNIDGLQQQNQKLLRITRELGEKMENEEREYKAAMEQEQAEAIREAHEAMQELAGQLESQKRNSDAIIQAYVKERDALKSMLSRAKAAASRAGVNLDVGQAPSAGQIIAAMPDSEVARELAEVQQQFEMYKTETGVDSTRLREELTSAQREIHELNASLAKANAKVEYLNERHRVHAEQFQLTNRELEDMTKRSQTLFDQWTRADIECGRLSEDLHVTNGRLEQLRNECANLRAEKQIWEGVQARLLDDNKTLALERSHLSDLMSNIQKMHNDLERSGENDRRRLETQLQMLESQTQDLKTQLARERDSVRHTTLQKDLEAKELQARLDKANLELSKTRESLVGAETSKQHLEERVGDLTKHLHGLQEKVGVYERRPTTTTAAPALLADPRLSREQQLEQEVAELRSSLKVAEVDLDAARGHVQQFKEISQANEVALSNLNSTFDEYKASTESQIARHEAECKALEEKLEAANKDLADLRQHYNSTQKAFDEERTALKNDKKTLEDTIIDMTTSEKHLESDRTSREQEVRTLEERAKAAEDRYSHEVVAHAESIKLIENLRRDLSAAQTKAREHQSASETAVAKLTASEQSWNQQKQTLDKEISDLNGRCRDLASQNSLLHQHLESVSSQAAKIRQAATDSTPTGEGDTSADTDTKLAELRSVVSYLRKEKEIVDLQLELSKQENSRLKTQIEHLSQSLQEARTTISEERERAVESAASAAQHAELVERINQLNILRESNAMLRADCESHAKKARDLETKLAQLNTELEPAKEQARVAQAELEAARGQVQRLEQESHGWQERNKQLLSKYDRVDPAEIQALKDEIEKLKAELEVATRAKTQLEEEMATKQTSLDEQIRKIELMDRNFKRYKEQALNRVKEVNNQKTALVEEKKQLESKIATLESSGATPTAVPDPGLAEELKKQEIALASLREERDKLLAEKETWTKSASASTAETPASWEAEKVELAKARDEALQNLKTAQEAAQKAAVEKRSIQMQNDKFQSRLADLLKARAGDQERTDAAIAAAVAKAKSEMQATAASAESTEELAKKQAAALENLRKELQAKYAADLKAALETANNQASSNGDQQAAIQAAIEKQKKALEEQHNKEIEAARESGRIESSMKIKLKDSQLTKSLKRLKELEAQIREWEAAGKIPQNSLGNISQAPSIASIPVAGGSAAPAAQKPAVPPAPGAQPAPTAAARPAPQTAAQGQKQSVSAVASRPAPGGAPARGGAPIRGRAGAPGVRAGPSRPLPTRPAATSGGISIAGAAAAAAASTATPKRPRDEVESTGGEDSLAKRLKPAESATASGTPGAPAAKHVQIRRPPPGS